MLPAAQAAISQRLAKNGYFPAQLLRRPKRVVTRMNPGFRADAIQPVHYLAHFVMPGIVAAVVRPRG